ncbi:MAG: hypothetical protein GX433_11750 [Deltaproteobacteria bacterium]|nr:hypothetical protein [Deltaproteobacteria bacterium]
MMSIVHLEHLHFSLKDTGLVVIAFQKTGTFQPGHRIGQGCPFLHVTETFLQNISQSCPAHPVTDNPDEKVRYIFFQCRGDTQGFEKRDESSLADFTAETGPIKTGSVKGKYFPVPLILKECKPFPFIPEQGSCQPCICNRVVEGFFDQFIVLYEAVIWIFRKSQWREKERIDNGFFQELQLSADAVQGRDVVIKQVMPQEIGHTG